MTLRDQDTSDRLRPIRPLPKRPGEPSQPVLQANVLDLIEGDAIHASCGTHASGMGAVVGFRQLVRMGKDVVLFEACSAFTRIAACRTARPPEAAFVTRLRCGQLPDRTARQLTDPIDSARVVSSSHWVYARYRTHPRQRTSPLET